MGIYDNAAHRGGTDKYPKLTIYGALYSLAKGADLIEVDVRYTLDMVPVAVHDNPEKISAFLEKNIYPILFHNKFSDEKLLIFLKMLRNYDYEEKIIVGVQTVNAMNIVKSFKLEIPVLAFMPAKENIYDFINAGADIIRLWESWVSKDLVQRIHDLGKQVYIMANDQDSGGIGYTKKENLKAWKKMGYDGVLINDIAAFAPL